jgi:hypothetical protein
MLILTFKPSQIGRIIRDVDFLMGYESYLRKRRISVSSRRYKLIGKHRHSLR